MLQRAVPRGPGHLPPRAGAPAGRHRRRRPARDRRRRWTPARTRWSPRPARRASTAATGARRGQQARAARRRRRAAGVAAAGDHRLPRLPAPQPRGAATWRRAPRRWAGTCWRWACRPPASPSTAARFRSTWNVPGALAGARPRCAADDARAARWAARAGPATARSATLWCVPPASPGRRRAARRCSTVARARLTRSDVPARARPSPAPAGGSCCARWPAAPNRRWPCCRPSRRRLARPALGLPPAPAADLGAP
ncbi:MAG: hypothetical protein MZW92_16625 [Comamonadaceae bacterium]|nr:hypothetical protein [Comamonadaceae bacterium]